jgi:SAM-dependent methyltransferase
MKLSELVAYRELLEEMRDQVNTRIIGDALDPVIHVVSSHNNQFPSLLAELQNTRNTADQSIKQFVTHLDILISRVMDQITSLEPAYLAASYRLYEEGNAYDSADHILGRRFGTSDQITQYIQSRVQAHSNWTHAGLIIRPGREYWIEHMVACDPLYVVDTHHDLFAPIKQKFSDLYRSRLRFFAIQESSEHTMLHDLPDNQFGFCLAYNFFHYKPFEIMRGYLGEIYAKLRPGGVLAFTFNDGDRRGAVDLAERNMNCYTPGRLVTGICEKLGFEIEQKQIISAAATWIELRKPGIKPSLRGGQTLAKITIKPEIAELHVLKSLANEFRMEDPDVIDNYTSDELKYLIISKGKGNILKDLAKSK